MKGHKADLLGIFAHHRVAANLLMLMMLLGGVFALNQLNIQFFPTFDLEVVTVRVLWTGASAEDIEDGITNPLEQRLKSANNLHKLTSTSTLGVSSLTLEFQEGTDPLLALDELQLSLDEIAQRIAEFSKDQPAGIVGDGDSARELRSLEQRRDEWGYAQLPTVSQGASRIDLGSVATVKRQARDRQVGLSVNGEPAVELVLKRAENGDSIESADILEQWFEDTLPTLSPGVEIQVYDTAWKLIKGRIMLLVKNGLGGLALVVVILYLFLSGRVAFWVAVGIPISFMATLFILWLVGGSINMVSLFALIMALGIIVDDAIVVGEDALAHYQAGEQPLLAAEGGARRMLAPVVASSLTTIAAFLPLMLIGGIMGNILFDIPLVIVSVILASLVESFLVLPGHLRHSFLHSQKVAANSLRDRLDRGFNHFREQFFRPLITLAIAYRGVTISLAIALLLLALGLLAGGRLSFVFFPAPESQVLFANVNFVAGTPRTEVDALLGHLEQTLKDAVDDLEGGDLIQVSLTRHGANSGDHQPSAFARGDQLGSIQIELTPPDERSIRNERFVRAWREHIELPAGIESFTITSRRPGPPGRDLTIRLIGTDAGDLKNAALELMETLKGIPGVSEVQDDMPYGREQLIYSLSPAGQALGLTVTELGRQLRSAFDGRLVQIFQDGPEEVEVRVQLPKEERDRLSTLQRINIRVPEGGFVPLSTVVQWDFRQGLEVLRHAQGRLAVEVTADVDRSQNNANVIQDNLVLNVLPEIISRYRVEYSFEGRAADQRETLEDMKKGMMLGLVLIYLVLSWVFSSYGWPLVVMSAIPFGLVGALFGHLAMGLDVTILSLFGVFGLSGIVVNDSIILVSFFSRLRDEGMGIEAALIEASCQRLRAVLLTSLTTIAGLTPLLFETSLQAQFLIPMATSIAFGLAFSTVLVLIVVPSILSVHESIRLRIPLFAGQRA